MSKSAYFLVGIRGNMIFLFCTLSASVQNVMCIKLGKNSKNSNLLWNAAIDYIFVFVGTLKIIKTILESWKKVCSRVVHLNSSAMQWATIMVTQGSHTNTRKGQAERRTLSFLRQKRPWRPKFGGFFVQSEDYNMLCLTKMYVVIMGKWRLTTNH